MDRSQDMGASSGSRASAEPSSTVSALTGFDPARLASLIPPPEEVRVLDNMSEDIIYSAEKLAGWARLSERRVKEILRSFKSRGWAWYDVAYDEDEYRVCGSGYSRSPTGTDALNLIEAIAAGTRSAETRSKAQPEGSQSVIAQPNSEDNS